VIVAALLPLTLVALHAVGGVHGLTEKVKHFKGLGEPALHASRGLAIHHVTNPLKSDWIGVVFGLGFVLGFGYWTTNFAEVQRALSARNMSASRRTPLIGAYPKIFLPATDESQGAGQNISGGVIGRVAGRGGLRSPRVSSVRLAGTVLTRFLPEFA
jgi:uncharacterized sodium:solute symporter family permease YidK